MPRSGTGGGTAGRPAWERSRGWRWRRAGWRCDARPLPTSSSSATRGTSTFRQPGVPPATAPSCSTHSSRSSTRSSTTGGAFGPRSLAGRALRTVDRVAFRTADYVVADTAAQADFYVDRFGLERDRVGVCLVGAEDRLFSPQPGEPADFHALFVGKLIPLHGLETILDAARLAPEIPFRVMRQRPARDPARERPGKRRAHPLGRLREAAFGASQRRVRARDLRDVRQSVARGSEQGLPGARVRCPTRDGGHAGGARAPHARRGRGARSARGRACSANAVRRLAGDAQMARRIGVAGRATYERTASEAVLGACWRSLLEQFAA